MPIYTYRCQKCAHDFEELILSADAEKGLACPKCGAKTIERRMAPFAAVVNGPSAAPSCSDGSCPTCPYTG
jgi:putative FmdB family regulatory protein